MRKANYPTGLRKTQSVTPFNNVRKLASASFSTSNSSSSKSVFSNGKTSKVSSLSDRDLVNYVQMLEQSDSENCGDSSQTAMPSSMSNPQAYSSSPAPAPQASSSSGCCCCCNSCSCSNSNSQAQTPIQPNISVPSAIQPMQGNGQAPQNGQTLTGLPGMPENYRIPTMVQQPNTIVPLTAGQSPIPYVNYIPGYNPNPQNKTRYV